MTVRGPKLYPLAPALVLGLLACQFDADYAGTNYLCPDLRCPTGYLCVAGQCQLVGAVDAAVDAADSDAWGDARVDAAPAADAAPPADAPGVCDLAALAADNPSCGYAIELHGGDTVYGDTTDYGNDYQLPTITCAEKTTVGADAVYRIDLVAGAHLVATLSPKDWDGALYLYDVCTSPAACVDGSDVTAINQAETVEHTAASTMTYYLVIDGASVADQGCFTLTVQVTGP